jgi:serine/threonine-protein kinase
VIGEHFGSYVVLGELGRGAMGVVYRARHVTLGAERAVKVFDGPADPELVVRFKREAAALARVAGPGIVPVHEAGIERGRMYFAMGLVGGGSLRDKLAARGRLPWREAAALVLDAARALARCHAAGLVHRDLKPANVLLGEDGKPWVADFGCVRDLGASRLTETGTLLGTPSYMAPEQLEGRPADARSDVFALGVVLHELALGTRPFAGRGPIELLARSAPAAALRSPPSRESRRRSSASSRALSPPTPRRVPRAPASSRRSSRPC